MGLHLGQCVVFLFWSRESWLVVWFSPPSDSSCGGCLPHADFADAALPLEEPQRSACFDVNKKKKWHFTSCCYNVTFTVCRIPFSWSRLKKTSPKNKTKICCTHTRVRSYLLLLCSFHKGNTTDTSRSFQSNLLNPVTLTLLEQSSLWFLQTFLWLFGLFDCRETFNDSSSA